MKKTTTMLWGLVALTALGLAGRQHAPLRSARRELWPEEAARALDDAPPLVRITTVAFAGFQGLIADLLWLRVSQLQDRGHYFEIVQLADWITKLEPRFSEVWAFHAWNMAYNISIMFAEPEDRWRWVNHGIRLLRDEGLRYNPADPRLYHELGWIYQHKIGRHWDDAHMTYKWNLAQKMHPLLDNGHLDKKRFAEDTEMRKHLRDNYGLEPDSMLAVDMAYGPLDWRAADTHAVYWAWRGLQVTPEGGGMLNKRLLFQGLSHIFRQGRIILDNERRVLLASPRHDLFDSIQKAFTNALDRYPEEKTIRIAYRNFLGDAITLFFVYGHYAEAHKAFDEFRKRFPDEEKTGENMQDFAMHNIIKDMEQISLRHAAAMIEGFYYQGARYRALNQNEQADAMYRVADFLWQRAESRFGGRAATAMPPAGQLRQLAEQRAFKALGEKAD